MTLFGKVRTQLIDTIADSLESDTDSWQISDKKLEGTTILVQFSSALGTVENSIALYHSDEIFYISLGAFQLTTFIRNSQYDNEGFKKLEMAFNVALEEIKNRKIPQPKKRNNK
jgi:hypothetical protein